MAIAAAAPLGRTQLIGVAPTQVLLSTQFRIPLTYEAALAKLDDFYQEQVGRKLDAAFPAIGPKQHYDVWHDIWVSFEPAGEQLQVTMKRPADNITGRLVRSWMLSFAGRLNAEIPLAYKELPPLQTADSDIFATQRDLAAILPAQSLKPLATWQHQGLAAGASPMVSVVLDPAGLRGVHHVTVSADSAADAKQILARLLQGAQRPGICGVYSETAELDAEIYKEAQSKTDVVGANTTGTIYTPELTHRHQEDRVRADPEMQKRIQAAAGNIDIRYRIDKPYRQMIVTWTALDGYSRPTGQFQGERPLGRGTVATPKMTPGAPPLTARTKLEPLKPGAYRVRLDGEFVAGQPVKIDERIFWFDGKVFEEL